MVKNSWSIYQENTRMREINGLIEAMEFYNLEKGLILTDSEEEIIQIHDKTIEVKPVWKWLLEF